MALVLAGALAATAASAHARDFSGEALNVMPPGQAGTFSITPHSIDQIALYDGLTPKFGSVRQRDLRRFFKSARFGVGGQRPRRVERAGRRGLRILRDRWDVPHVYARSRTDVMFGSGWVAAADRGTLMEELRGPAEIATLDVPGLDAIDLALSLRPVRSERRDQPLRQPAARPASQPWAQGRARARRLPRIR